MTTQAILIMFAPFAVLWAVMTAGFVAMQIAVWRADRERN
jgi:hypothetical protein